MLPNSEFESLYYNRIRIRDRMKALYICLVNMNFFNFFFLLYLYKVTGFSIIAEKINYLRYCSHFRSVHRGSFFAEMKTTSVHLPTFTSINLFFGGRGGLLLITSPLSLLLISLILEIGSKTPSRKLGISLPCSHTRRNTLWFVESHGCQMQSTFC